MLKENNPDREYYSLVHEIKSYGFLKNIGNIRLSNDEKHEKGPDLTYGRNKIECVCCSEGRILDIGYSEYSINYCQKKSTIIDYNKTKEYLLPRITNSLGVKRDKINEYINEGIIKKDDIPIIFISLGGLNIDFNSGTYGDGLLEVLIGKGPLCYTFDRETGKAIDVAWQHKEEIKKFNGNELVDINANFFNRSNPEISGIIFSTAPIYEPYNYNNVFLFVNPYAKNKIKLRDFKDIIYWKSNNHNKYIPMKRSKSIWNDKAFNVF